MSADWKTLPLINADDTDPQNRLPSFRKNREMMGTGVSSSALDS
jgi:hypothetical protein